MKFLHAADLHLDSPLHGLERYEGAPVDEIRGATRRALENLVRLAIEQQVAFVLLAGDQYDGDHDDYRTVLFFTQQMNRLRDAGIRVFAITGNHDAASKMTKSLRLPDNVRLLSSKKPETIELDDFGVVIHGRGFAKQAEMENFVPDYPSARAGRFNIGMLHTSLDGREGHASYAPCSLADLRRPDYDYWALGHVHQRKIEVVAPLVVFPGNVQGRHIREPGAKGCYLVTVDERNQAALEFMPLDVFRWAVCDVPADGAEHGDEIVDRVSEQLAKLLGEQETRPLGVRVKVNGPTSAHAKLRADVEKWTNEIRAAAQSVDAGRLWIEKVEFRTSPPRDAIASQLDGPLGELLDYLRELRGDETKLTELGGALDELRRKLPANPTQDNAPLLPNDAAWLREVLDDVEPLLVERLIGQEARP